jgi:diacylglycerol kinase family enzyme
MSTPTPQSRAATPLVAVVANGDAGRRRAPEIADAALAALPDWGVVVFSPTSAEQLSSVCAGLDAGRYHAAIVIGGDGTQHHALRGLRTSGVPLYPYPAGTANDLSRAMGLDGSWPQVRRLLAGFAVRAIDLIEANGIPFATVGGLGLGARVVADYNRSRRGLGGVLGENVYTYLTVKNTLLGRGTSTRVVLRTASHESQVDMLASFVCNQPTLGGNLHVARGALLDDGRIETLVIPAGGRVATLRHLVALRRAHRAPGCLSFAGQEVSFSSMDGAPLLVFGDGETLASAAEVAFRVQPGAASIFCEGSARQVGGVDESPDGDSSPRRRWTGEAANKGFHVFE